MNPTFKPDSGVIPVIPTPFTADEHLDSEGLENLANFTLQYPFKAIWALATAGEDENMSQSSIDEAAKGFIRVFKGKLPIWIKTSEPGTKESIDRTKKMADWGLDAAIIHFQHKMMGDEHVRRYFIDIADQSPVPILIYHNATRGGKMSVNLISELSAHPNIIGMKAGGSQLSELHQLIHYTDENFHVMTAGAGQLMPCLAMGVAAHMAIPLIAFPEISIRISELIKDGNLDEARKQQKRILDFIKTMPKLLNREVNGETKAILEIRGIIKRHVTSPFIEANDQQMKEFEKLINDLNIFSAEI